MDNKFYTSYEFLIKEIRRSNGQERGIAIGVERGTETTTLKAIRNLIESLKLTAEQAMEALKVPEEEKIKYAGMLRN